MANFYKDNEDLQYYFERGIDWEPLIEATEFGFNDPDGSDDRSEAITFYREIAEMVGEFVAQEVAPKAPAIDAKGARLENGEVRFPPELQQIFDKIKELDLHGMCLPRSLGGMNAPLLLYFLNTELFGRADVSVMAHHGFHGGIAMSMLTFSIEEGTTEFDPNTGRILKTRFDDAIAEITRGEAWGCMDITEPDAGSDMAALRSRGEQDDDGNWYVSGEKIFITSGHGKYHFVIARTEKDQDPSDPRSGLSGLSMFLVPTYEEDADGNRRRLAEIARVEEKMGHHGSATCAMSFDRTPAFLIGKRGEGFKHMLMLMNNARLGVGFESIGLCEAAFRLARDYAAERKSMGKTIDRHEIVADYLDEMATDIQGLRALAIHGAHHEELAQKKRLRLAYDRNLDDDDRKALEQERMEHSRKARRVTPLIKFLATEKAVEMARRCLQIHGGNGYMKDYGAEKLVRDAVAMPIYEGTSQIQALMAMRDTLTGPLRNPQRFVARLAQARWRAISSRDPLERQLGRIQTISLGAQQHLLAKTAGDKFRSLRDKPLTEWPDRFLKNWDPKRDFAYALLHAERLTRLLADESICAVLWRQAEKHPDRRELAERYFERAEPRCRYLNEVITSGGERLIQQLGDNESLDEVTPAAAAE